MDISFKFDPEVLIGSDTISLAGTIASRHGSRIMIAADNGLGSSSVNRLKEILVDSGLEAIVFDGIDNNSQADLADSVAELTCAAHCDAIIGFGGEKTQTIARMAAIMAPIKITAFELLDGKSIQNKFLPLLSIPTESMSAFSSTSYFIAVDPRSRLVKTIQSPCNLYSAVIIDSNLFKFLSNTDAAAYVLESFFYAIETYCSAKANFISDTLLEKAISFYAKLIRSAAGNSAAPMSANAELFAQASILSSLGSSVSSPGFGSALSTAINARTPAARQLCSAVLFPFVAERLVNARPEKMARIASFFTNTKAASIAEAAMSAVDNIRRAMAALNVPSSLKEYNIPLDRLTAAAEAARNLDFVTNSPWPVSEEEVFKILKEII